MIPLCITFFLYGIDWSLKRKTERLLLEYAEENKSVWNLKRQDFEFEPLKPKIMIPKIERIKIEPLQLKLGEYKKEISKSEQNTNPANTTSRDNPSSISSSTNQASLNDPIQDSNTKSNKAEVNDRWLKNVVTDPDKIIDKPLISEAEWKFQKLLGIGFIFIPKIFEIAYDRVRDSSDGLNDRDFSSINENKIRIQSKETIYEEPYIIIFIGKQLSTGLNQDIFNFQNDIYKEMSSLDQEFKKVATEVSRNNNMTLLNWGNPDYLKVGENYALRTSCLLNSTYSKKNKKSVDYHFFGINHIYYFQAFYNADLADECEIIIKKMLESFEITAEK